MISDSKNYTIRKEDLASKDGKKPKIDDQFVCTLCKSIVQDPEECSECGCWSCKACISDLKKKNKKIELKCPNENCKKLYDSRVPH